MRREMEEDKAIEKALHEAALSQVSHYSKSHALHSPMHPPEASQYDVLFHSSTSLTRSDCPCLADPS